MSNFTFVSIDQLTELGKLVDIIGVGLYRDLKEKLGIGRMKPGQELTRAEAEILINEMAKIKRDNC